MNDGYQRVADADHDALARMLMMAFGGIDAQLNLEWARDRAGLDTFRVWREGGEAVGCAAMIEMGQFFGGRSVPMDGVAGVAVAPEVRGKGVATRLMTALVHEIKERGTPISTLYPATQPLYRRVGYEPAGHRYRTKIDVRRVGFRSNEPVVRAATEGDREAMQRCAAAFGATHDGVLDRGRYVWSRIFRSRDNKHDLPTLVIDGADGIDGYMVYWQEHGGSLAARGDGQTAHVVDLAATTAEASRRLVSVLGELSSICGHAVLTTGPMHPVLLLMPEIAFRCELLDHWMTRIIDVPSAVAARGYATGIDAEVHLDIADDVIESNNGRWVVRVRDGAGTAERGGRGDARMHVRQLASIYTGFVSPKQLAQVGMINGDGVALDTLGAVFAGPAPWMPDMF